MFSKIYLLCARAIFLSEQIPSPSHDITPSDFSLFATVSFSSLVDINRAQSLVQSPLLKGQFFIQILYTKIIIWYNQNMKNILIVIDDIEFRYFEFNKLVTNFWFIFEFLNRDYNVLITLKSRLFQKNIKNYSKKTYY